MSDRAITIQLSVRNLDEVRRGLESLGTVGEGALKKLDDASKKAIQSSNGQTASAKAMRGAFDELSTSATNLANRLGPVGSILSSLGPTGVAAAAAFAGLATTMGASVRAGDQFTQQMARLANAAGSARGAVEVYEQLYQASLRAGVAIEDSVSAFTRFAIAAREIGATNDQIAQAVESIQKFGIVSGSSAQETASAVTQLGQALASGRLQGDELRSVMESLPRLAEALSKELGVSMGQLRTLGSEGKLTADVVLPAIVAAGKNINDEFEKMPASIGRGWASLGTAFQRVLANLDQASGGASRLGALLQQAAGWLDRIASGIVTTQRDAAQLVADRAANAVEAAQKAVADAEARARTGAYGLDATAERDIAALREVLAQRIQEQESAQIALMQIDREGDDQRFRDGQAATARAREFQQGAANERLRAAQEETDQTLKIRREYAAKREAIEKDIAAGLIDRSAGVAAVKALADKEAAEIKRIEDARTKSDRAAEESAEKAFARREELAKKEAERALKRGREQQQEIELLRREGELIGATVAHRNRELAILRERQRIINEGHDPDTAASRAMIERAAQLADMRTEIERQQGAFDMLAGAAEQAANRIGDALVQAFIEGKSGAIDFGNVARAALASIATTAAQMALINPITNTLFGSNRPTLYDVATPTGGSGFSLGSLSSLDRLFSSGSSLSPGLDAWAMRNFGFGAIPGTTLPTTVVTGPGGMLVGGGAQSIAPSSNMFAGFGSASNLLGIGGAILPGLMSGNYGQAGLGGIGTAAGLMIGGPIGLTIGGIAGNLLGGSLFGGKTKHPAWGATIAGADGRLSLAATASKHLDAAEVFQQIRQDIDAINTLMTQYGLFIENTRLVLGEGNAIAQPDTLGEVFPMLRFRSASNDNLTTALAGRAFTSPEELTRITDWVVNVYTQLSALPKPVSEFDQAMDALLAQWNGAIGTARELGLAETQLIANRDAAIKNLSDQRDLQIHAIDIGYQVRRLQAQGLDQDATLLAFDTAANAEVAQLRAGLDAMGGAGTAWAIERITLAENTLAQERLAIQRRYADEAKALEEQAGRDRLSAERDRLSAERDALRMLRSQSSILSGALDTAALNGPSPQLSFLAAQQQFGASVSAARAAGTRDADLYAVAASLSSLLSANDRFYGAGAQGAGVRDLALSQVRELGVALDLPGFSTQLEDGLARAMAPLGDEVSRLRDEVAALREELRRTRLRQAA